MNRLLSFFRRPVVFTPIAVRAGDDIVLTVENRLDSHDALAMLNTLKKHFPGMRIHLLTGFNGGKVERVNRGSKGARGNDGGNPPFPVCDPSGANPLFKAAASCDKGDVMAITHATGRNLIAVYIPPKKQCDTVQ